MARVSRAISPVYVPSVINRFIFGQGVVIYFIMQLLLKKSSEKQPHLLPSEEICNPPSCLFCQQVQEESAANSELGEFKPPPLVNSDPVEKRYEIANSFCK